MAAKNYDEIRQLIINTLEGRPAGTMIYPEGHQEIDLSILDFANAISSVISTGIAGEAQASTQPIQPSGSNVAYIFQVAPDSTKTFTNFRDSGGNAISVTTNSSQAAVGFLLWNGSYWSAMTVYIAVTSPAFETISSDIIQLLDGETPVYPRTKAEAVFLDGDTTKTVDVELSRLSKDSSFLLNSAKIFGEGDAKTFGPITASAQAFDNFLVNIPAGSVIAFKLSYNTATTTRVIVRYNGGSNKRLIDTSFSSSSVASKYNNQWIIPNTGVTEDISYLGIYLWGAVGDTLTLSYAILKEPIIKDGILDINKFYLSAPYETGSAAPMLNVPNTMPGVIAYIPPIFQRAGLQVKFIDSDGVYKHYNLVSDAWSSDVNDWKEVAYVEPEPVPEVPIISKNVLQLEPISEELVNGVSFAVGKRFSIVNDQIVLTDDADWTVRKYVVPRNTVIQYRGTAPKDTADIASVFNLSDVLLKRYQGMKLYPTSSAETLPLEDDRDFFSGLAANSSLVTYVLLNTKSGRDFFVNKFVKKDLIEESTEESYDKDGITKQVVGNNILKPLVTTYQGAYSDGGMGATGIPNQNDPALMAMPYCIFRVDVRKLAGKRLFLEKEPVTNRVSMRFVYALDGNGNRTYYGTNENYYDVQEGDAVVLISKSILEFNLPNYDGFQPLMIAEGDFANQIGVMVGETTQEIVPFTRYSEIFVLPENHDLIDEKQIVSKKNLDDAISGIGDIGYPNSVSILNSDRIAFIGDSYTESSFTPEGKAYVNKLSLFSDYAFMNMAVSGDIYTGQLNKIRTHTEPYGVNFLKYVPKFTMLCCFTNDIKYMDFQTYLGCVENAIRFIRAAGSEPIVCTEYHISGYYLTGTQGLEALAKRYNCKFINIANAVSTIRGADYAPFWGGSHPGVRSNAIESDNYEKLLEEFERPDRSIKVFRLRSGVSYSELDDLTFNNNYERAKLFKEINVGHKALTNPAFVDNCTTAATSSIADEYRKIGDGENVSLTKVSLISFVLPLTSTEIGDSLLKLGGTFSGKLYLRDVSASPYPNITIYQRFDIVSGQTVPSIDDVYSGTIGGTTQNFTVKSIISGAGEGGSDVVLCSPRATGYSDNSGGTLTKVSGSGPASLEYSYTSPGYEEGVPSDTCGHWVEILDGAVPENGLQISQSVIKKAMKYDRLDILMINSGNAFNVNNVELLFKGQIGKTKIGIRDERKIIIPNYYNTETELVAHPVFGEAGVLDTNWNVIPTKVYEDIQADKKTYPLGCISKVNVSAESSIETSVTVSPGKYSLEIDARYFPPIYTDGSGEQITVDSFDYALLKVEIRDGGASEANANKTQSVMFEKVNTHWKLCQFELTYYISGAIKIIISSGDKEIEIAKVSMKKI